MTPFVKQLIVGSAPLLAALSVGGAVAYPTVLLHQLKSNDTSFELDIDSASWLGSVHGFGGIPSIFLPIIMQWKGRKFGFIGACLVTVVGWIVAYAAGSVAMLLAAELLHGLGSNSILAVSFLTISEMIAPTHRQAYMQLYGILVILTMSINGLLTQYLHWRTIAIVMCMPMIGATIVAFIWPESPQWLAMKGDYDKSEEAFKWLRGTDESSMNELKELVGSMKHSAADKQKTKLSFNQLWAKISRRDLYLPTLHMFVLQYLFYWSGTLVISIYAIDVIQQSTHNYDVAQFGGLIMNMIVGVGSALCIGLTKYFNKKPILLWGIAIAVVSHLGASVACGLQNIGTLSENSLVPFYFLVLFMTANGLGIYPLVYPIAVEIMPVKHRGLGGSLIVICSCILHSSSLKISPYLFVYIGLWGTFLLFAINSLCSGILIWKYIPETKDKTLQQIENFYMYGTFYTRTNSEGVVEPMVKEF